MYNKLNDIAKAISYFTEIALTAIIPIAIWLAIAQFIKTKFELDSYVVLIGILLGIASSYSALFKLFKRISDDAKNKETHKRNDDSE